MTSTMSTTEQLQQFEDWLYETGMSAQTTTQRIKFAQARIREWGRLDPTPAVASQWITARTGWTRITYYNHLTSIYAWMLETGQIHRSPIARVQRGPRPEPAPKPLSDAEWETVTDLAEASGNANLRAWLLLGALAGFRSHEIAKIRGEDVTRAKTYVVGKGAKHASVPTHPQVWELAQEYPRIGHWFPSRRYPGQPIGTSYIGYAIGQLLKEAGLTGSIHRCRATYATNLRRNGVDVRTIQILMRHSSLATTEAYLGVMNTELDDAIATLSA